MDETKKMLQAIINGQSSMKSELLQKIEKLDLRMDKLDKKVDSLDKKIDGVETRLTKRIDNMGRHLAYLDDDSPTREEYEGLEKRVRKLEQKNLVM